MVNEKYDDKKILKDIFLGSLELADPVKKLEKMKFDSPLGRLFLERIKEKPMELLSFLKMKNVMN